MWDDFENEDSNDKIPFPGAWSGLNEMMNGGMEKGDRKSTRLNSSHSAKSRMPSSA